MSFWYSHHDVSPFIITLYPAHSMARRLKREDELIQTGFYKNSLHFNNPLAYIVTNQKLKTNGYQKKSALPLIIIQSPVHLDDPVMHFVLRKHHIRRYTGKVYPLRTKGSNSMI